MPRPLKFKSRWMVLPVWVLLASVALAIPLALWFSFALSPLQREYLPTYMAAAMTGATGRTVPVEWIWKTAPKRKPELAADADVISAAAADTHGLSLALSPAARAGGWTGLMRAKQMRRTGNESVVLRDEFFAGESLTRMFVTPLCGTAISFLLYLAFRQKFGSQSKHEERHGRRTKGPELVSSLGVLKGRAGGIKFRLTSKLGPLTPSFCIPRKLESSHILLMGDTGSGKSNAIRQILRQVQKRGETAIVYDPAGEFVQEFYKPERGDLILNPLDERCPYWDLPAELLYGGTADAIAAAMLPEKEFENKFFIDAPRRVLARLLNSRPSVQQLLAWMADPSEIERRLEGTPQAAYLDKAAGPQRAGVLGSLNMIADSLALLPEKDEKRESFATERWEFFRTRWVFLTSKPSLRERILPLHSAWLDLLILHMMEPCANPAKPVWFVLDELASLNKLPQLHTAVTENRKYGNPVVLGFQGRSQLEKRYGHDAEAMLSQPATKIFFKTSEPRAAKWISETLGEIEVERMKESRTPGLLTSKKHFAMEIATKPLVMASEIAGLEPLRGYIKQENRVVPVRFALVPTRSLQPEFIEREFTVPEPRLVLPVSSPEPLKGAASQPTPAPKKPASSKPTPVPAAPVPSPAQPKKPRMPFGRKLGTDGQKPRDWDESQWID